MKAGDLVKMAHYGTLAPREEHAKLMEQKWGLGLVTEVYPATAGRVDCTGETITWTQVEVIWSQSGISKAVDLEKLEML